MAVQRETEGPGGDTYRNLPAAVVSESSESTAVGVSPGRRRQRCFRCGQTGHLDVGR